MRPSLPVELVETVIGFSDLESIKSWNLVCRNSRPAARHHLLDLATIRLDNEASAEDFSSSTISSFPSRVCVCGPTPSTLLPHLAQTRVVDLTVDVRQTPVETEIFRSLVRSSGSCPPFPSVTHLEIVGSPKTVAYRVLELIVLFPNLESLKLTGLRWDVITKLYWIPFPARLTSLEAQVEDVLSAAVILLSMFSHPLERETKEFRLTVHHDRSRALQKFMDEEDAEEAERHYFWHVLRALDVGLPSVENLCLDVPLPKVNSETETRAYLERQGFLPNLKALVVNGQQLINNL